MTFDELCAVEPGLRELAAEAERFAADTAGDETVCANARWYGYHGAGLKERLVKLVGHWREIPGYVAPPLADLPEPFVRMDDPRLLANRDAEAEARRSALAALPLEAAAAQRHLCTSEAYDVAYDHVYNLLPNCRGVCECVATMQAFGVV